MKNYFKENLKFLREQKNMSQNSLSKLTNVSQATINRWESGENIPSIDNVIDIASVLKVPIEDIIGKDLRTNTSYEPTEEDLKRVLEKKGLLNKDGKLDEDKIDRVNRIFEVIIDKKEN